MAEGVLVARLREWASVERSRRQGRLRGVPTAPPEVFEEAAAALTEHEQRVGELTRALAKCYRLSGADPDGDEDAMLARHAVQAVRELREESDANGEEELALREKAEADYQALREAVEGEIERLRIQAGEDMLVHCNDEADRLANLLNEGGKG